MIFFRFFQQKTHLIGFVIFQRQPETVRGRLFRGLIQPDAEQSPAKLRHWLYNRRMPRKSVYLETSFISYLTSRPSRDLIAAASQAMTRDWWDTRRSAFELYVSELVLEEAKDGHPEAAAKRLEVMADIELLNITDEVIAFARTLVTELVIPEKAAADAIHISVAAVNGINYLMTWNCKHIANAEIFEAIEARCEQHGYRAPVICTPQELLEMH